MSILISISRKGGLFSKHLIINSSNILAIPLQVKDLTFEY
jgi:hypothetical protein